jgi:large subunit ribosomal protein L2
MTLTNVNTKKKVKIKKNNTIKKPLIKKSITGLTKTAGRNHSGKITIRHKGNGNKNRYRKIDFSRTSSLIGITCSIEYDPNRNSNIAAIYNFFDNDFNYIISAKNLKVGDILKSGIFSKLKLGHSLPINHIPVGAYIYNLKLKNSKFSKISRAAGTFSEIKEKILNFALIKISSGKYI